MSEVASTAMLACERLERSRESLRQALRKTTAQTGAARTPAWLDGLQSLPGVASLFEATSTWWEQHPLHHAADLLATSAKSLLHPVAQRYPGSLLLGALVLGAVLIRIRPWRWLLTPALAASVVPTLVRGLAGNKDLHNWLAGLSSAAQRTGKSSAEI